jgi:hypothetical protein
MAMVVGESLLGIHGCGRRFYRLDQRRKIAEGDAFVNDLRFIIQVSKGILRSQRARRVLMFYDALIVMVMTFSGATFLASRLRAHPFWFIFYWVACLWLTALAAGLAIYDMARVRLEAREARRQLKKELLGEAPKDSSHDSDAH